MENIEHRIYLELNNCGYNGSEINEILPDFITERKTLVGLTWEPSAEGPESFTLLIIITASLSSMITTFLAELSKDLYQWTKSKLIPLFKKKKNPSGYVIFEIGNIRISYFSEGGEEISELFSSLSDILNKIDANKTEGEWEIEYTEQKEWIIEYRPPRNYD